MKIAKKIYAMALSLCITSVSHGALRHNGDFQKRAELDLETQKKLFLRMIEEKLIVPSQEGARLTDESLSILEELEKEGRLIPFESRKAYVCADGDDGGGLPDRPPLLRI